MSARYTTRCDTENRNHLIYAEKCAFISSPGSFFRQFFSFFLFFNLLLLDTCDLLLTFHLQLFDPIQPLFFESAPPLLRRFYFIKTARKIKTRLLRNSASADSWVARCRAVELRVVWQWVQCLCCRHDVSESKELQIQKNVLRLFNVRPV